MLHGKNIVHMTQGSNELHFFYDASNKPAIVEFNGSKYAYVHNLQGDIVAILDSNGAAVVQYKYDAWGKPISKTGSMKDSLGTLNPFRYRGYVYDEETELYYLKNRFYIPNNCRFLNADVLIGKLSYPLSHVLFTYCRNNPVKYADPTGMEAVAIVVGILLAALGIGVPTVAYAPDKDFELTAKERHYNRLNYYQDYPDVFDPSFFAGWDDAVPADCHQFTAIYGPNVKYVSPDGLHEVIYDARGNEVTDPRDIGTYNYKSPDDFWGHFWEDVYPWLLWGNSPEDTTTREQRIDAFANGAGDYAPYVRDILPWVISVVGEPD